MMRGYIRSSPHFFRLIGQAALLLTAALLILAAVMPAPLQEGGDLARVPNPVKSAWFLLWIQEAVSYSKYLIIAVLVAAAAFVSLPWLPQPPPGKNAQWFSRRRLPVHLVILLIVATVVALEFVALFCRGENWQLVAPF